MAHSTEEAGRDEPRAWNDNRERKAAEPVQAKIATKVANSRERLRESQLSKKAALGLMVAAAVLTMIVGFNWGGWVSGGTLQQQVDTGAKNAVALRLVPICVAQFNLDGDKAAKLDELKVITSSRERLDYVKAQGWATIPGEAAPDNDVANECTKLLMSN